MFSPSARPSPDIKVFFHASATVWLFPNELSLSQIRREIFDGRLESPSSLRLETFNSLERSLSSELRPPEADELARRLILADLARELAGVLHQDLAAGDFSPSGLLKLADDLGDAFDRLKLAGLNWNQVATLPPAPLGRTLAELGRRHDAWLIQASRMDHFARRRLMLDKLKEGRHFEALAGVREIVCRWSQRLSPFETDFITALAENIEVKLTLKIPAWIRDENIDHGSGFDLLRSIKNLERSGLNRLWLDFEAIGESPIPPALAYAAENLLAPASYRRSEPPSPDGCLKLLATPTSYHEVEETARRIKKLMVEGLSPDDLAVVVPDVDQYSPLLDDVARRFGLAFHLRRGRPLTEYGPVKAILALLDLWDSNWERSRLTELVRSPYFILADPPLDAALVNRLTLASGMSDRRAGGGYELLAKIQQGGQTGQTAEKLLKIFEKLDEAGKKATQAEDWPTLISVFTGLLNELGWPGRIDLAPASPLNVQAADLSSALAFKEELERLAKSLTESPVAPEATPAIFRLWLEKILSEKHLSWDNDPEGRIRVLNYYDLHGGMFEEIFFLGLNERIFPHTGPVGRWWPQEFVSAASTLLGRPMWNEDGDNYRQEELLLADGLAQAKRRVWLFHHRGDDDGKEMLASPLLAALQDLWPSPEGKSLIGIEPVGGHGHASLEQAAGRDELILALARMESTRWPDDFRSQENLALTEELDRRHQRWARMKKTAAPGFEATERWLKKLPHIEGRPLVTPSFPAAFASCPLAFWASNALGLSKDGEALEEWPRSGEGTLLHAVLENFFRPRLGRLWPGLESYEDCRAELLAILDRESEKHARENPLGRLPLWNLRRGRLDDFLSRWLKREMNMARNVRPLKVEWSFGSTDQDTAGPYEFHFPDGRSIFFKGRVDRIDETETGLSVNDYKLSDRPDLRLSKEQEGLRVNPAVWPILIYALAASSHFGRKVEAGFEILDPAFKKGRIPTLNTDRLEMVRPRNGENQHEAIGKHDPSLVNARGAFPIQSTIAEVWNRLSLGLFPPEGRENGSCAWCPLGLLCPVSDQEREEPGS